MLYTTMSRRTALSLISAAAATPFMGCGDLAGSSPQPTSRVTSATRPRYHLTPATEWINDPQRPIFLNGVWNMWVLYAADYPTDTGTAWRHYTSTDLVTWTDQGISIPKDTTQYGDVWTGSTVVDTNNTAGHGAGALIALMTMPANNTGSGGATSAGGGTGQNQSTALWYSNDNGKTFSFDSIVQPNYPGNNATFRDPSIFWHVPTQKWIMSLAETNKLSVYTSTNLKNWTYASGLVNTQLGTMECPNLFPLHLYASDGTTVMSDKWILLCGANGYLTGRTINTYYWVGSFDGITFTPDNAGTWLDFGSDFYACTVFTPSGTGDALASATAIAWMNNWDYASVFPTIDYFGQLSTTRNLKLQVVNGVETLINSPLPALNSVFTATVNGTDQVISDATVYSFPTWANTPASRIDFTITQQNGAWPGAIFVSLRGGGGYFTQLTFDFGKQNIFLFRADGGPQPTTDAAWVNNSNAPFTYPQPTLTVSILLDVNSIEIFINGGQISISSLITAPLDATSLGMNLAGGSALISNLTIHSVA
jgi:levanase